MNLMQTGSNCCTKCSQAFPVRFAVMNTNRRGGLGTRLVQTWQALSILSFHLPCTTPNQAAHTRPFSFLWWWFLASVVVKDWRGEEEAVMVVHANMDPDTHTVMKLTSRLSSVCRIFHELKLFCRSTLSFCTRKDM